MWNTWNEDSYFLYYIVTDVSKNYCSASVMTSWGIFDQSNLRQENTFPWQEHYSCITVEMLWHYVYLLVVLYMHTNKYVKALYKYMCYYNEDFFLVCHRMFVSITDRSKSQLYIISQFVFRYCRKKFSHICNMDLYQYYYRLINQMIAFI